MATSRRLTRAERRAARPGDGPRVFDFYIVDAGADGWLSRVVFFAESTRAANDRCRAMGLHKRVMESDIARTDIPTEARVLAETSPHLAFLSQDNDDGWSPWRALPDGYVHPSQGQSAKRPELRLTPADDGRTWQWRTRPADS